MGLYIIHSGINGTHFTFLQVGSNGVISFQEGFSHHQPVLFPSGVSFAFLLAPFWSDIDLTTNGSIRYQIHDQLNSALLLQVNDFISNYTDSSFTGTWMLVVEWTEVVEHETSNPVIISPSITIYTQSLIDSVVINWDDTDACMDSVYYW